MKWMEDHWPSEDVEAAKAAMIEAVGAITLSKFYSSRSFLPFRWYATKHRRFPRGQAVKISQVTRYLQQQRRAVRHPAQ